MKRFYAGLAVAAMGAALAAAAFAQTKKESAAAAKGGASTERKSGPCALKPYDFGKGAVVVEVGRVVKGKCSFYIDDFFGKKIINANIEITNTGQKPMFCQYYVAFFDKEGAMIGCASQGNFGDEGFPAGETTTLGSCLIPLPLGEHERVASYQASFYESEAEIGK